MSNRQPYNVDKMYTYLRGYLYSSLASLMQIRLVKMELHI